MEAFSCLLGAPWRLSGSLLEASWRPLGGLLGAPWGPFGESGDKVEVKHHFGGFEFCGRAVLKPSWGRFLKFFEAILEFLLRLFRRPSSQQIEHAKSTFL